ncbi:putative mitochondrial intermembrane space import and assembly protein 40 protein [Diplogelasinospora grovesii]|uniref:Mitochondrial intermembrane space import and assembly protein 40 n=1 Tax=Diplogelasinospora grovesii TaxID=303347 RepID=A0AAN6N290_9PEZI|nr:putative mitochondrial intermembrane space import and assembly protein 40 protein [Diplogelasinospora grovesii]
MYRTALRTSPSALRAARPTTLASGSRRFLTTAPADKKRTWKGAAARWGLAAAAVYWYNTSPIFADELPPQTRPAPPQFSDSDLPTVDAVIEEKRRHTTPAAPSNPPLPKEAEPTKSVAADALPAVPAAGASAPEPGSAEAEAQALEEEAGQQGAFNPETGEINWDCPCLGGMAHGPCGEEFKTAFSCFVYSKEEPKGMDCIDKFQHMQDCFRKYPEIYGSELQDFEDEAETQTHAHSHWAEDAPGAGAATLGKETTPTPSTSAAQPVTEEASQKAKVSTPAAEESISDGQVQQLREEAVPQEAHDASEANNKSKEQQANNKSKEQQANNKSKEQQ